MSIAPALCNNDLLACLKPEDLLSLVAHFDAVELALCLVLYEPGRNISHVYFPTTAILSLVCRLENGSSAEIAVVGREGVVGIALFMGGNTTALRAAVQSAGQGYRMRAEIMKEVFTRSCTSCCTTRRR